MATVQETIDKLVEEHGQNTLGIYILERALLEALGLKDEATLYISAQGDTKVRFVSEMPRYIQLRAEEQQIMDRIKTRFGI